MRYLSTRGHADRKQFCEILLEGLAPDGGLYLPESYPQIDATALTRLRGYGKPKAMLALAFEVLSLYIDDIPRGDLQALCKKTYTSEVFGTKEIVPLKPLQSAGQAQPDLYLGSLVQRSHLGFQRHGHAAAGQLV
jgi:threonine synthase